MEHADKIDAMRLTRSMFESVDRPEIHDRTRDLYESIDFLMQKTDGLLVEREYIILDALEIALNGGYRRLDLMRKIRQKITSDLFLEAQVLIKCVDRIDERIELVVLEVTDLLIGFFVDDVADILRDPLHRSEGISDPSVGSKQDEDYEERIHTQHREEDSPDEERFGSISLEHREIKDIHEE